MEDEKIIEEAETTEDVADDVAEDPSEEIAEEEATEEAEMADEETEPEEEGMDLDSLQYDDDGNIVDEIEEEEPSTEAVEPEEEKKDEGAGKDATKDEEDPREAEFRTLQEEFLRLKAQSKATLKALGVEKENELEGLAELAAEIEGVSTEEYLKNQEAEIQKAKDAHDREVQEFEILAAKDLAELQAEYPEAKSYKHVRDMPPDVLKKFAELRNKGVSAVDAYASANRHGIRSYAASSAKKATASGKEHLRSSVPKASHSDAPKMTRSELEYWRGMFPKKSDKEIIQIYRKTY
jgi:hypothetical protein